MNIDFPPFIYLAIMSSLHAFHTSYNCQLYSGFCSVYRLSLSLHSQFVIGVDIGEMCTIGRKGEQAPDLNSHHLCSFFPLLKCRSMLFSGFPKVKLSL
jgi:hypothetical protein